MSFFKKLFESTFGSNNPDEYISINNQIDKRLAERERQIRNKTELGLVGACLNDWDIIVERYHPADPDYYHSAPNYEIFKIKGYVSHLQNLIRNGWDIYESEIIPNRFRLFTFKVIRYNR